MKGASIIFLLLLAYRLFQDETRIDTLERDNKSALRLYTGGISVLGPDGTKYVTVITPQTEDTGETAMILNEDTQ
jgi:hypothetical protein